MVSMNSSVVRAAKRAKGAPTLALPWDSITATQLPLPWLQLHTRMHRLLPGWLTHKQHVVVLRQLIGAHLRYGAKTMAEFSCWRFSY